MLTILLIESAAALALLVHFRRLVYLILQSALFLYWPAGNWIDTSMNMPGSFLVEEQGPQGWGTSSSLRTAPFDTIGGQHANQGFKLNAAFTRGGIHTLTFQLTPTIPANSQSLLIRALADISWSAGGQTVRRTAHVGSGTSVSGVGEAVSCLLRDDSILAPDAVEPYPASLVYNATIIATAGVRPPSPNPPFYAPKLTQNYKYQAGDDETVLDIPTDAGVNSVFIYTSALDMNEDIRAFKIRSYPGFATWDGSSLGRWLPLIPGIRQLAIKNEMATDVFASVLFGIDG